MLAFFFPKCVLPSRLHHLGGCKNVPLRQHWMTGCGPRYVMFECPNEELYLLFRLGFESGQKVCGRVHTAGDVCFSKIEL